MNEDIVPHSQNINWTSLKWYSWKDSIGNIIIHVWAVNAVDEEIQLRNAEYEICGIDDDAEVLQTGEEET